MTTARISRENADSVVENLNSTLYVEALFSRAVPWGTRENPKPDGGYFVSFEIDLGGTASEFDFEDTFDRIVLPSGARRTLLEVDIVDDVLEEIDETFGLRFVDSNFADLSSDSFSIKILDNDRREPDDDNGEDTSEQKFLNHQNFEVHRFFNQDTGRHFYTGSKEEGEFVLNTLDSFLLEESSSFFSASPNEWSTSPVYRFFNQDTGVHFYTINEEEKDNIIENLDQFSFEGTGFHAWNSDIAPTNSVELHRFFNPDTGAHFFSLSEEAEFVRNNLPQFQYEGVAFNVFDDEGETGHWADITVNGIEISGVQPDGTLDMSVSFDRTGNTNIPVEGSLGGAVEFFSISGSSLGEVEFNFEINDDTIAGGVITDFDGVIPIGLIGRVEVSAYSEFAEPYTSFDNLFTDTIPSFAILL